MVPGCPFVGQSYHGRAQVRWGSLEGAFGDLLQTLPTLITRPSLSLWRTCRVDALASTSAALAATGVLVTAVVAQVGAALRGQACRAATAVVAA